MNNPYDPDFAPDNRLSVNSDSVNVPDEAAAEAVPVLDALATEHLEKRITGKSSQVARNYQAFCDFVNAFNSRGLNPGENATVFHVKLQARGQNVILTYAPGELLVSVRATAPKKSLVQRIKRYFSGQS